MALGIGLAAVRSDKNSGNDAFGLVALCSIGPILSVMLLGIVMPTWTRLTPPCPSPRWPPPRRPPPLFVHELPDYGRGGGRGPAAHCGHLRPLPADLPPLPPAPAAEDAGGFSLHLPGPGPLPHRGERGLPPRRRHHRRGPSPPGGPAGCWCPSGPWWATSSSGPSPLCGCWPGRWRRSPTAPSPSGPSTWPCPSASPSPWAWPWCGSLRGSHPVVPDPRLRGGPGDDLPGPPDLHRRGLRLRRGGLGPHDHHLPPPLAMGGLRGGGGRRAHRRLRHRGPWWP